MEHRVPCAISHELIEMFARRYPKRFKKPDGSININKLLFHLGFKVDNDGHSKHYGYFMNFDVHIRDNFNPSKIYKTRCVYNGEVRNIVWMFDPRTGRPIYTRQLHPIHRLYEQFEVLQPKEISSMIPEDRFQDILDFGDPIMYYTS